MLHSLLARQRPPRCGLAIPLHGLLFLQPYLYSMTHTPIPFITITPHLYQVHMVQHHTDLPRLLVWGITVVRVILAVSQAGVLQAAAILLLMAAACLPAAAVVAFHPVAVAMMVLLVVVHPVVAVVLLAAAVVPPVVVEVPLVLLPDPLLCPFILHPPNHSP